MDLYILRTPFKTFLLIKYLELIVKKALMSYLRVLQVVPVYPSVQLQKGFLSFMIHFPLFSHFNGHFSENKFY